MATLETGDKQFGRSARRNDEEVLAEQAIKKSAGEQTNRALFRREERLPLTEQANDGHQFMQAGGGAVGFDI